MILIAYDGSADAQAAIGCAGELMPGRAATVLTVWEGLTEVLARTRAGEAISALDFEQIDAASEQAARRQADEAVERATRAGFVAEPRVRHVDGSIWETIVAQAGELDAEAIVLGSRGLTGIKSLLLGSVSHAVLQHADRPVMVVPSPEVAAKRAARRAAGRG